MAFALLPLPDRVVVLGRVGLVIAGSCNLRCHSGVPGLACRGGLAGRVVVVVVRVRWEGKRSTRIFDRRRFKQDKTNQAKTSKTNTINNHYLPANAWGLKS